MSDPRDSHPDAAPPPVPTAPLRLDQMTATPRHDPAGSGAGQDGPPRPGGPLDPLCDDGPLDLLPVGATLPVPGTVLLVLALLVMGATAGGWLPLATWQGAAVAVVLGLASRVGRPLARLDWLVPAGLRALEYSLVLLLVGASGWSFALLATLAVRHYDIVYRVRLRGTAPPVWIGAVTGGWFGRSAVLVAAAAFGPVGVVAAVMTVVLAPVITAELVTSWLTHTRES